MSDSKKLQLQPVSQSRGGGGKKPPVDEAEAIRPRGTVLVPCSGGCDFEFWVGALDPRLPDGPFVCSVCLEGKEVRA